MGVKLFDYKVESIFVVPPGLTEDAKLVGAHLMHPTTRGKDVVVAVIDTGADSDHPDLASNIVGGRNFCMDKDYNFDPNKWEDDNGHGTWVAGKVAGVTTGIAPEAKLLILKALNYSGSGKREWVLNALNYAKAWRGPNGERVNLINMSLGTYAYDSNYHNVFKDVVATGISIVCAAGNAGDGKDVTDEVAYPAAFPEAIAVGALDLQRNVASFSNSNKEIDVAAPGVDTVSTYLEGQYARLSGTSMACPVASGFLALLLSKHKLRTGAFPSEPVAYNLLKDYTVDVYKLGIDANTGAGMVSFWPEGISLMAVQERTVNFWIGRKEIEVDGQKYPLDSAPMLDRNGRSQILARAYTELAQGGKVNWHQAEQRVETRFLHPA